MLLKEPSFRTENSVTAEGASTSMAGISVVYLAVV